MTEERMGDELFAARVASAHASIARALPNHVDARTVELAAFTVLGHRELGLRIWHAARAAGGAAKASRAAKVRLEFGVRDPHGWVAIVAAVSAIFAGVGAAIAASSDRSPFRFDHELVAVLFAVVAALASLLVTVTARGRPLNRSMLRIHGVLALAPAATALLLVGGWPSGLSVLAAACAAVTAVGFVLVLVARSRDTSETRRIDAALDSAARATLPEVRAATAALEQEARSELGDETAVDLARIRGQVLRELRAHGIAVPDVGDEVPAGAVIVSTLISTWLPAQLSPEEPWAQEPAL